MKCNCMEWLLRKLFRGYSKFLCRFPLSIILITLFVASGLGAGILFMEFQSDAEFLFSPITSRAKEEREILNDLFPVDDRHTLPNRLIYLTQRQVSIAITCTDDGNILRQDSVQAVLDLDEEIRKLEVYPATRSTPANFTNLCNQWNDHCFPDPVTSSLRYYNNNDSVVTVPFPEVTLPTGVSYDIAPFFGGRTIMNDELVAADALLLSYSLQSSPEDIDTLSADWEMAVTNLLHELNSDVIEVNGYTSASLDESQTNLAFAAIPYLAASYFILIMFAVVSCIMIRDGTQSKPWLGVLGVVSASLAVVSAVGLLSYVGVPFNQVALSMPFIILGIGLDDMFIMIAAWRKTDPSLPVVDRIAGTFEDAAVSISITSLTDILAFCVGAISPIPAIRIFCLYTGVAVFFDFLYQITFFGACMVLFGYMEYFDCNGCTCVPIDRRVDVYESNNDLTNGQMMHRTPNNAQSQAYESTDVETNRSNGQAHYHHRSQQESNDDEKGRPVKHHAMMIFFRDYYAKLIYKPVSLLVICLSYVIYLAAAVYFSTTLEMGLEQANIAEEGTMTHGYFTLQSKYFKETGPSVSVVFTEPLPYWDISEQAKIEMFLIDIHEKSHVKPRNVSDIWLDEYKKYLQVRFSTSVVDQETFVRILRDDFLTLPCCERFQLDINFNESEIASSRFILVSGDTFSSVDEEELLLGIRDSIDEATEALGVPVIASSLGFVFAEQYIIIVPTTVLTLGIAVASMLLVSLIMMPNIVVGILVTLSVASILLGVIGFMALWGVALESISMVNLVLCIGFSVDFSAHVAYAFVMDSEEKNLSAYDKLSRSVYLLGFPILQSGFSTIIGVSLLFWSSSYIFRTFAKIMTLVMTLGMLHGLVFLPAMITIVAYLREACCDKNRHDQRESASHARSVSATVGADNEGMVIDEH